MMNDINKYIGGQYLLKVVYEVVDNRDVFFVSLLYSFNTDSTTLDILREKSVSIILSNTAWKVSKLGIFLACTFPHSD